MRTHGRESSKVASLNFLNLYKSFVSRERTIKPTYIERLIGRTVLCCNDYREFTILIIYVFLVRKYGNLHTPIR